MNNQFDPYVRKVRDFLKNKKLLREFIEEFFNHGIGYIAGLLAYNYLESIFEVKGIRNLWGAANFRKKVLIEQDTFDSMEFIISGIVGFIIFKIVSHYSSKFWDWYERRVEIISSVGQVSKPDIETVASEDIF